MTFQLMSVILILLKIVDLNLASTTEELESVICLVLSSDITLFEKISSSTYRLRIDSVIRKFEDYQSDTGSGGVDDDPSEFATCSSDYDSGCDTGNSSLRRLKYMNDHKSNTLQVYTEIDESHPGEVWLLGLMEGEYSDLSIEEKLNVLVTLIDLLCAGSNIRMEVNYRSYCHDVFGFLFTITIIIIIILIVMACVYYFWYGVGVLGKEIEL